MAVKRSSSSLHVLHFLVRLIGLTGALAALVGWFIWGVLATERVGVLPALRGLSIQEGFTEEQVGLIVIFLGVLVVALALLFEVRAIGQVVGSHRGAFGFNVLLQIGLALTIVAGVNYFAIVEFKRYDLTRDRIFTLDDSIRAQLSQMRGDTEIVVYHNHVSFAQRGKSERDKASRAKNKQDKIDFAAQRKIIEKVKDLVEQFQDLGPRFRVHFLDMEDDNYDKRVSEIRAISEELGDAIDAAEENSVFFFSKEHKQIQRLSFSDIYQIDTQGSIKDKNLVLHYQSEKPFANKIFNIEEKRPRVALAVIHPVLGFQNKEMPIFTMSGAKKVLDDFGFESTDVMLRKIGEDGDLTEEATALTYDESRYEQIEDELVEMDDAIKSAQKEIVELEEQYKYWSESTLAELNIKHVYVWLVDGRQGVMLRTQLPNLKKAGVVDKSTDVDDDDKKSRTTGYKQGLEIIRHVLETNQKEKSSLLEEKATLKVENLAEKRRLTDVEAKMKGMLANVDLLIVPRITILNAATSRVISNRVHRLDSAQLNAIKSYLKDGKPVLFLLGPSNEPREAPEFGGPGDQLEAMLAEFGFKLPKQTILYNVEAREFNERKFGGAFAAGNREVDVPGLKFDDTTSTLQLTKTKEEFVPHPIRTSLRLMSRTSAKRDSDKKQADKKEPDKKAEDVAAAEVRIRHPRPVYFLRTSLDPQAGTTLVGGLSLPGMAGPLFASAVWLNKAQHKPDDNAVFLVTREESWNEDMPFIIKNKVPRFTPNKDDDPKKNTIEEARRCPFPIGVAVETTVPASWSDKESSKPKTARIAVIGSGGAFVGNELTPLKEKMLLDVSNWLIGRDDLLARDVETWQYPRIEMGYVEKSLWQWGAVLGLPLAFVYIGIIVWMVRRMR